MPKVYAKGFLFVEILLFCPSGQHAPTGNWQKNSNTTGACFFLLVDNDPNCPLASPLWSPIYENTDASTFSTSIAVSHKYRSKSFQELFRASKATTPVEGVEHVFVDVSNPNLLSAIYP